MKIIYTIALVLLIGVGGCKETPKEKKNVIAQSGTDIDKIQLTDLAGQPHEIKRYNNKTVFVNFWASWCKPCIMEMPSIEKMQTRLKDENIIFLLASNEDVKEIEVFKKKNNYTFNYTRIENMEALNIQGLPTTFIYNREGKLVFSEMGIRNWNDSTNIEIILKIINQND